jgi:hypothetical protein
MTRAAALFALGDYIAGGLVGATTAAVVHSCVSPSLDMVLAMLLGMGIGMLIHLALGLLLAPFLGLFHVMVPSSLIGMYGGMLFAMRDSMQHAGSLRDALVVGVIFGLIVVAGVHLYDRSLHGTASTDQAT